MKKKVAIITVTGYNNYGNKLQNYAVQHILEKLEFEVETIKTQTSAPIKKISFIKRLYKNKNKILKKISNKINALKYNKIYNLRRNKFIQFSKKYIKETDFVISLNNIPENLHTKYDFFVTGSDQVWNPFQKGSEIEFLMFVPKEKRISISASIGTNFIPKERIDYFTKALNQMSKISVRENEAKKIVENLTNRSDIEVLLDPTMALEKEEWLKISNNKVITSEKYILVFFLGEISDEYNNFIQKIARNNNLEIIQLLNPKFKEYFLSDPSDFIGLVNNTSFICTDSFHGAVFSIIFNKKFLIFDRVEKEQASMNSRLTTLLHKFNLTDRYWSSDYNLNNINVSIDYDKINELLIEERLKTYNFLKEALK